MDRPVAQAAATNPDDVNHDVEPAQSPGHGGHGRLHHLRVGDVAHLDIGVVSPLTIHADRGHAGGAQRGDGGSSDPA